MIVCPSPPLVALTETPTVRRDGSLLVTAGYDPSTRLYYDPAASLNLPDVPLAPSDAQTTAGAKLLRSIIIDFPFEDEASRANTIGAMLTPCLRPMIGGHVPMVLFDKPQAGVGASLLAEIISIIATGRGAAMMAMPAKEEEWAKQITSQIMAGHTLITVDNIEGTLASPTLAKILTSSIHEDRVLGQSKIITLEHRTIWIGTGNNIRLAGDLPRRCYWVRMIAAGARPWERAPETYTIPELAKWVTDNRGAILAAILTLARAWVSAGRPKATTPTRLGGFEDWVRVVGGILSHAGITDFLGNQTAMYAQVDDSGPQWEAFLEAWQKLWADSSQTVATIVAALPENESLRDALPDELADGATKDGKDAKGFNRRFAWALRRQNGVKLPNGLVLQRGRKEERGAKWQVVSWRQ